MAHRSRNHQPSGEFAEFGWREPGLATKVAGCREQIRVGEEDHCLSQWCETTAALVVRQRADPPLCGFGHGANTTLGGFGEHVIRQACFYL